MQNNDPQYEKITFGAGCFWCVEAVFLNVEGVVAVESGYSNGRVKKPTYREVCSGLTGCVEVAQVTYDPAVVTTDELLEIFWQTHDPTTLNRQGNDVGSQYRSGVYYHSDVQRRKAEFYKEKLDASGAFRNPIVTEIVPLVDYSPAENYHQNYFENNPAQGYCRFIVQPKVDKLKRVFPDKVKKVST